MIIFFDFVSKANVEIEKVMAKFINFKILDSSCLELHYKNEYSYWSKEIYLEKDDGPFKKRFKIILNKYDFPESDEEINMIEIYENFKLDKIQ